MKAFVLNYWFLRTRKCCADLESVFLQAPINLREGCVYVGVCVKSDTLKKQRIKVFYTIKPLNDLAF